MAIVNDTDTVPLGRSERAVARWRHGLGLALAAADAVVIFAVVILASFGYHLAAYGARGDERVALELAAVLSAIFVAGNTMRKRYKLTHYLAVRGQITSAFTAWNMTMIAFIGLMFLAKIDHYSRAVVLATYLIGIPVLSLARCAIVRMISTASRSGRITAERVFLIGREADVMGFVSQHRPWNHGLSIVDVVFLRDHDGRRGADSSMATDLANAAARCRQLRPDTVFIAMPWADERALDGCVDAFMNLPVAIHLTPEGLLERFEHTRVSRIGSLATLQLTRPSRPLSAIAAKQVFDIAAAAVILFASLPFLLLIALAIRIDTPGPVLFKQRRHGFNQQSFRIFKFRTMTTMEDGAVVRQATRGDSRITRVGSILRRYNLDELPQLLNVLLGQMSLVGPRPHALAHDREFELKIARYARRHNVKPGITGWAQVHGLRGETDTDQKMAERVTFDHWYIDNWSFMLDIEILFRTLSPKAFRNAG